MQASITIDEILDKNTDTHQIAIATKNINGTPIFNKGTISVFKLKAPGRPLRNRPWAFPDYPIINQKEYLTKFPYEAYKKESNVQEWEKEKLVFTSSYDTEKGTKVPLNSISKWSSGKYMVVLHTKDSTGKSIKDVKL
ncbi:hypothetical protein [Tenacibaculum sp. SG-28]|uniref:hypothetical protein n=1 Tax=Tenacibaculum sp. SG-28 TaxID=754426 RepID=UPI000CF482AD|nr:hypothetical protein [Tenacibaculum sp. SG-28]PQJ20634.1 hypothetical protein BSU00_10020 [Tenacibaculum sp. SG-28]